GFLIDRNLTDTIDFVLNWIFDGDDIYRLLPDFIDEGIKGRRLPAAGRAYGQQHSLRSAYQAVQAFFNGGLKSKLAEGHQGSAFSQDTKHNFFAPSCREYRNTNVRPVRLFAGDVTILRNPALADIELCENLDANDQVLMHPLWNLEGLVEHAVNPITNAR